MVKGLENRQSFSPTIKDLQRHQAPDTHVFWGDLNAADQLCGFPVVEGQATDGANAKHVAPMDACKISQITYVSHFIMMEGERW